MRAASAMRRTCCKPPRGTNGNILNEKFALFISPHLDDVAFSCGGTLAKLLRADRTAIVCTIFTASVDDPRGFALRCQTDKGLAPDIDYMLLRRAEDAEFARAIGGAELHHLTFREAPHRGYESAAELFAGERLDDKVWREIADELKSLARELNPQIVFAPQGLGNHVDHLQTIRAVRAAEFQVPVVWYRDTPYAIRDADAAPAPILPDDLNETAVGIDEEIEAKIEGCIAYTTQIGFQFGGADALREKLFGFHLREAATVRLADDARFAERFLAPVGLKLPAPFCQYHLR